MKKLSFLILFLFFNYSFSCINEYKTLLDGKVIYDDAGSFNIEPRFDINDKANLNKTLKLSYERYLKNKTLENYSDYGVMLLYNGKIKEALNLFQEIEKKHPNNYTTASNIGTIYELIGDNEKAYEWIKKAIMIYPKSHYGSEWIHLKILEAKIKSKGNEKYFENNNILGLNFGDGEIPIKPQNINLDQLKEQLSYQLTERITFIKPKDAIIAQLLFDLGNIIALKEDVEGSLNIMNKAKEYGLNSEIFLKRINFFNKITTEARLKNKFEPIIKDNIGTILLITLSAIILFILSIKFYKKYRKKSTNS